MIWFVEFGITCINRDMFKKKVALHDIAKIEKS